MFGNLLAILLYPFIFKLIKKFGNINSVKFGTLLILFSSIILMFSKKYHYILFGYSLYIFASSFKSMDNVILRKNLKYQGRESDYIKIQNKASFIHSFLTMLIAFISGFLFNINNYLPMILCVFVCIFNVILSCFLYENKNNISNENKKKCSNTKLVLTSIMFFIILLYGTLFSTIDLGQANSRLFIQYKLSSFLEINKVSIFLSFIIAFSRIVRVVSNYFFVKYYKFDNKKILYKIGFVLICGFIFVIVGGLLKYQVFGIILMSIGFFGLFSICDLLKNYMQTLLLNNCEEQNYEQAITYLALARKTGKFLLGSVITLLLVKIDILYIIILFFIISIINIFIIRKIYRLAKI